VLPSLGKRTSPAKKNKSHRLRRFILTSAGCAVHFSVLVSCRFGASPVLKKVRLVRWRDSSSPGAMRARRGIAARYIKANSSRKGSRPHFSGPFSVSDTFSKIGVLTEEQAKAYIAPELLSLALTA
jgi:hypothetical protein